MAGQLLTVATPDYASRWRFCLESQNRYGARHGYDRTVHMTSVDGLHPKWAKVRYAIDGLKQGRSVMLIDADAEIAADCPPFTGLMQGHITSDIFYVRGASGRLNGGVMLFRCGPGSTALSYLETCLASRKRPLAAEHFVTSEGENGHMIQVMSEAGFADRALVLPREWNCTVSEGYRAAYVRHYTGQLRDAARRGLLDPQPADFARSM